MGTITSEASRAHEPEVVEADSTVAEGQEWPDESRCKKIASGQLGVECLPYRSQKENPVACLSKPLFLGQSLFTFECRVPSNTHR
jgi:hypothetical protein